MGFFRKIRTENEVRKLVFQCSPNGMTAGWNMPTLSDINVMYPSAGTFRTYAEQDGWKARDVAMAIVGGVINDTKARALQENDQERSKEVKEFFFNFLATVKEKDFWYDQAKFDTVLQMMISADTYCKSKYNC